MTDTVDTNNTGANPENETQESDSGQTQTPLEEGGEVETPAVETTEGENTEGEIDYASLSLPEGMEANEEFVSELKGIVEKYGLKDGNLKGNLEGFIKYITDASKADSDYRKQALEAKIKENENALKTDKEFGKDYFGNMKIATDTIMQFGGEELKEFIDKNPLMNNPIIVKTFYNIGKQIEDAKLITGIKSSGSDGRPKDIHGNNVLDFSKSFGK